MAAIDTVVADALDRAIDGCLTLGQVSEQLTAEAGTLDPASRAPWIRSLRTSLAYCGLTPTRPAAPGCAPICMTCSPRPDSLQPMSMPAVGDLSPDGLGEWFASRWADARPAT